MILCAIKNLLSVNILTIVLYVIEKFYYLLITESVLRFFEQKYILNVRSTSGIVQICIPLNIRAIGKFHHLQ